MYAVLSDIHGNLLALENVFEDMKHYSVEGIILLGDYIDYGMKSNEVVDFLINRNPYPMICSIWGNHENAIMKQEFFDFSSERGVLSAKYVEGTLSKNTRQILERFEKNGKKEFELKEKKCIALHGSMEDYFWKGITLEDLRGNYYDFDVVFSGHTHYSHFFTKFYEVEGYEKRNKKATVFINPGSVGQPRNHNPNAQYALVDMDTMSVVLRAVPYEIEKVQSEYHGEVDDFYRKRLEFGI